MMLTIVWNPHGFHLIDVLPNGSKFNPGHHISHILSPLPEILALYQNDPRTHFLIHADNARIHRVKELLSFWITIPDAKHLILLIRQIWLPQTSGFSGI
jgi:hypothetical protein